jgi:hypothetical protein
LALGWSLRMSGEWSSRKVISGEACVVDLLRMGVLILGAARANRFESVRHEKRNTLFLMVSLSGVSFAP